MQYIKSYMATEEKCGCLICDVYFEKGKRIFPQPQCHCGNIPFFDVTESYVRYAISWPIIGIEEDLHWQKSIIIQIKDGGRPSYVVNEPSKEIEIFDSFQSYY